MTENTPYVITIDGPGGSGKGSLALRLAKALNFHLLDSGAIYRLAALKALRAGVDIQQQKDVLEVLQDLRIHFENGDDLSIPFLDGEDVSAKIRLETTGDAASIIAQYEDVRASLLELQRAFFQPPGLVADGRDMGTVVFPHARIKFFLYASVEIRA
ncbi:MAG: (d)CMP kinase, partial [Gammaproteobacteria bacterium]|nr:(d)CMP kinase [Gammaproteobacteria bacterium]